jgi:hypothetical protein
MQTNMKQIGTYTQWHEIAVPAVFYDINDMNGGEEVFQNRHTNLVNNHLCLCKFL